jgi:hypothetical protein
MKIELAGLNRILAGLAAGTHPGRGWVAKKGASCLARLELDSGIPGGALLSPGRAAELRMTGKADAPPSTLSLWYRQPAARWEEALPVGNGFLGAIGGSGISQNSRPWSETTNVSVMNLLLDDLRGRLCEWAYFSCLVHLDRVYTGLAQDAKKRIIFAIG